MNRLETASQAAKLWKQIVVLKGAYTVVATPNGTGAINPIANPVLASAGTGDVLAGIITGLLSQGLSPFDSAICGVYVHGIAGSLMSEQIGNSGLLANDLLIQIPKAIKKIRETESPNHTISM
jgi:NAD(P)H-hydrate epimerase